MKQKCIKKFYLAHWQENQEDNINNSDSQLVGNATDMCI